MGQLYRFKVPVSLVVDRFANGGLEGSASPWIMSGVATRSTGTSPHCGKGYLHLGGAGRSSGSAYQEIAIPHHSSLNLEFWLNVTSSDPTPTANDKLFVEIRDTRGKLLATLATFSNLNNSAAGNYIAAGSYSLAGFAGHTVRIQFRTITDSSSITHFRIDDVSLK